MKLSPEVGEGDNGFGVNTTDVTIFDIANVVLERIIPTPSVMDTMDIPPFSN